MPAKIPIAENASKVKDLAVMTITAGRRLADPLGALSQVSEAALLRQLNSVLWAYGGNPAEESWRLTMTFVIAIPRYCASHGQDSPKILCWTAPRDAEWDLL